MKQEITEEELNKIKDVLNINSKLINEHEFLQKYILPESFLEEYIAKIDSIRKKYIFQYQLVSEDFIIKHHSSFMGVSIFKHQNISESFINKFGSKDLIKTYIAFNKFAGLDLIKRLKPKVDFSKYEICTICEEKECSKNFIRSYIDVIQIRWLQYNPYIDEDFLNTLKVFQ